MKSLLPTLFSLISLSLFAQPNTQTVRGTILDKDSEIPLIGANISIPVGFEELATITDSEGRFRINGVPVGRQSLIVSYLGYSSLTIPNVVVTSGKEVIMNLSLEESFTQLEEIIIKSKTPKDQSINEMAAVSTKTFSLEEVTRYSGGRNDVSRLVTNYAGVGTSNDSRNDIVIRGNSPTGVLWRLEGIPIPNPNHFSTLGTTGGPVSALNTNLLKNSDFLTSAFPAEYGNATSGVFDVGFRSGNKDKYEFTAQLGAFSGLEAMAEGPLNSSKTSSFLISYRHSFVALANAAGLDIGTAATPNYRDISFKIDIGKGKLGKVDIFGIGGTSDIDFIGQDLIEDDIFAPRDADSYVESLFGVLGIKHTYLFDNKTYLRTTLATSRSESSFLQEVYLDNSYSEKYNNTNVDDVQDRIVFSSYLNTKHSASLTTRGGITIERMSLNSFSQDRLNPDADGDGIPELRQLRDINGGFYVYQPFIQNKYRLSEKMTFNLGLHGLLMSKTQDLFLGPRVGINYELSRKSKINFGYGLHSQNQPLPVFFLLTEHADGSLVDANANLKFTKAHHFVIGYDYSLGKDWRAKIETYYQSLYDVPVERGSSSFSILNTGADFVFPQVDNLVNSGVGRNYGLELTIEKFFSQGYYGLFTTSLFESKYEGSDHIERNTAFNNNYIFNLLGGKEWKLGKNHSFSMDFKVTNSGGRFYTPVDLEASRIARTEISRDELAFSERYTPYFRFDVKLGFQINNSKYAQQFFLDFQNVTNRENVFQNRYDRAENTVNTFYQSGFFPDLLYRLQF